MQKVNIAEKFRVFDKYWQSKVVTEFNGQHVKLAKLKGEFEWHVHKGEDEFYLMLKGQLIVGFRDREVTLNEGDLFVIPANSEHRLTAREDVHLLLVDPTATSHSDAPPATSDPSQPTPIVKPSETAKTGDSKKS